MSYTYLQEQGGASSAESFSDIPAYALSSLNLTVEKSCCKDRKTESCHDSQFGMTCEPLTESRGKEKLTSCAEDFHAKTSALQTETLQDSLVSVPDYGEKCCVLLAKYDRSIASWKTPQLSLFEDLKECLVIWPRQGMTVSGAAYVVQMWVETIYGTEYGLLPTPRASMGKPCSKRIGVDSEEYRSNLEEYLGGKPNPDFAEWMMGWPIGWTNAITPLATAKFQQWLDSHGKH